MELRKYCMYILRFRLPYVWVVLFQVVSNNLLTIFGVPCAGDALSVACLTLSVEAQVYSG